MVGDDSTPCYAVGDHLSVLEVWRAFLKAVTTITTILLYTISYLLLYRGNETNIWLVEVEAKASVQAP